MLVECSFKLLFSTMCGESFKYMEFTFLENALNRGIFAHSLLHSKLTSNLLSSRPRQNNITHSPRQYSFENRFSSKAERGEGNYDLPYQNSIRKYEDDLEHKVFYILYNLQFFQMSIQFCK